MQNVPMDPAAFAANADRVATLLKAIANQRRLMVLCKLAERGEMTVGDIADAVDLSQSALSQHLTRLKEGGLVTFRRDAQTLWYRIADPKVETLMGTLYDLYCAGDA